MAKGKKPIKPFFFQDSEGNVFKATHVEDEEVVEETEKPKDEEPAKEEPKKEEPAKEEPKSEAKDEEGQFSAEEIAVLKVIAAERKAAMDAEKARKEAEEKAEALAADSANKDGDKKEEEAQPGKASDSAAGFGSVEDNNDVEVTDAEIKSQDEINKAWAKRYGGK